MASEVGPSYGAQRETTVANLGKRSTLPVERTDKPREVTRGPLPHAPMQAPPPVDRLAGRQPVATPSLRGPFKQENDTRYNDPSEGTGHGTVRPGGRKMR